MGRTFDAQKYFGKAVELDSGFAMASLGLALNGNSLSDFTTNLKVAEKSAMEASTAEQLFIKNFSLALKNDTDGQLATVEKITEIAPNSPRAWRLLANVQGNRNEHEASRKSLMKAIKLAPKMPGTHMQLGNSFMFGEPMNMVKAKKHIQHAINLKPKEWFPYDLLGDANRRTGNLKDAHAAYTKAAVYSGADGSPYQQRGHVNSFLGDYDAARADYDKAISMAQGNQGPSFAIFKAYVNIHAGNNKAAIKELKDIANSMDKTDTAGSEGIKAFALGSAFNIALHHDMHDKAKMILADWSVPMRAQGKSSGSEEFNRGQEAAIVYNQAMLASSMGDMKSAKAKVKELVKLVKPDANPRKMEGVNEVKGMIALQNKNYSDAAKYLSQGDVTNNIYIRYQLAKALEGSGKKSEAMDIYKDINTWNFNGVGYALIRKDAVSKTTM